MISAQKIGSSSESKPHIDFPDNAIGIDLMIGEGGFGFGTFYRYSFDNRLNGFIDFSVSEFKHEREIERFDIFGYPLPIFGKKNRVFILPLNFGAQYRLFYESLTDNLRPYITLGIGPTLLVTTPAQEEFFKAFGRAKADFGAGGYVGFGANFGTNENNLTGINIRYYIVQLFNDGVEQYFNEYKKSLQQVSLTINIGIMY
jgi:outer membrane protein W